MCSLINKKSVCERRRRLFGTDCDSENAARKFRSQQHAVCPGGLAAASGQLLADISAPSCRDSTPTHTHTHGVYWFGCSINVSDCVSSLCSARRRGSRSSLSSRTNRLRTKPVRRTETPRPPSPAPSPPPSCISTPSSNTPSTRQER